MIPVDPRLALLTALAVSILFVFGSFDTTQYGMKRAAIFVLAVNAILFALAAILLTFVI